MEKLQPLIAATLKKDVVEIGHLIAQGMDVDAADSSGRTSLIHAAIDNEIDVIKYLIKKGANVDWQDGDGFSPLHFASQNNFDEITKLLLNCGAQVDAQDKWGNTPLWRAVFNSKGKGAVIKLLLTHGADRNKLNNAGRSPLDLAETIANYNVVQFFGNEN